jgi:FKBP-type peptidyl-prolyl cis-trans isomerase
MLRKGTGKLPTKNNLVKIHSVGWLDDGKVLPGSSTYERNAPLVQSLGTSSALPGLSEGMLLTRAGGMIELEISPQVYGNRRGPGVPPGATLHFVVELLEIQ